MSKVHFDFLIVGAGIIGSAISYILSETLKRSNQKSNIGVIDLDLEGEYSSTLKNAGGVRSTWRNRANVELCKYSIDFFEKISDKIDFKQKGYFWLHDENSWEEINHNLNLYNEIGLNVELVSKNNIKNYLPFIENYEDIKGMSISRKAGLIDHYSLRQFFRTGSKNNGVDFIDNQYVFNITTENNSGISLTTSDISGLVRSRGIDVVRKYLKGEIPQSPTESINYSFDLLINSTGAWSSKLSKLYGYKEDEIKPRRRQIELFNCPGIDISEMGMIIDTTDIYFHQEGDNILAGYSNMDEPYGVNFKFDFFSYSEESPFTKYIWKPLVKRSSLFEKIKFIRGWSGIYGETHDRSGFIGKVPGFDNIFECVGHTGRGIMISYGAAQALVDIMLEGKLRDGLTSASDFHRSRPNGDLFEELHL
ncbi:MAG: FAD-dependent oxidoreductase [Candidatus Dadabacteria bacterium]|nr:FAD-dependent oxidoreductase [Candidatus Dadabacteria bacterium]NIQ16825.1 FAD-dependent oxidoreductase [Candidatus Dadabacteria bacterium]